MQNGICEAFNGRMRDELLNETILYDLGHAREALARWAASYNQTRPHSALGYLTPAAFARTFTATADRLRNPDPASPIVRCSLGAHAPIPAPDSGSEWMKLEGHSIACRDLCDLRAAQGRGAFRFRCDRKNRAISRLAFGPWESL